MQGWTGHYAPVQTLETMETLKYLDSDKQALIREIEVVEL
jgi:hypothetical protein